VKSLILHVWHQSGLLLATGFFFGLTLGVAQVWLEPRIQANRLSETLDRIPDLVPGAVSGRASGREFEALDAEGLVCGTVTRAGGGGFGGPIELLLGWKGQELTGVYILAQNETPGLGTRITDPDWLKSFAGCQRGTACVLNEDVDGWTGATISSKAVVDAVNTALIPEVGHE